MEFPIIQPIRDERELELVKQAAAADNHRLLWPTHILLKDKTIVGAWSVLSAPTADVWHHTDKISARESVFLLSQMNNLMRCLRQTSYVIPVSLKSPYLPLMERMGYSRLGETILYQAHL